MERFRTWTFTEINRTFPMQFASNGQRMKMLKLMLVLLLLAAAVVGGFVLGQKKGVDTDKIKAESKAAAAEAKDAVENAVKKGSQVAGEVATDVVAVTKEGVQKSGEIATNVAAKAKVAASNAINTLADVTTNVVDQARQKLNGSPR
jgi:hypothetical protein